MYLKTKQLRYWPLCKNYIQIKINTRNGEMSFCFKNKIAASPFTSYITNPISTCLGGIPGSTELTASFGYIVSAYSINGRSFHI